MPSPSDKVVVKCHSQRTVSLLQYIRKLRLGKLDDDGKPVAGSVPDESAVHAALTATIKETRAEFFGFVPKFTALLERLLDERGQVLLQSNQDLPDVVFPARSYVICSENLPAEGMARHEVVKLVEQYDQLIQLLERCRLAGAVNTDNYHSLVRRLDGSERNAFRRLRARVNSSLCGS